MSATRRESIEIMKGRLLSQVNCSLARVRSRVIN